MSASVRQVIDANAAVTHYYTYDPWGNALEEAGDIFYNPYRFAGYYRDIAADSYYCVNRSYYPNVGRFTSRDPVPCRFLDPMTMHKYLYCKNDPVNRIDPLGLNAYYITGGFLASLGYSLAGQVGIVWDDKGNWGLISTESTGGGVISMSGGVNIGITDAETILNLRGPGWAGGVGGNLGVLGAGGEFIWGKGYKGIEFNIGIGASIPRVEGHLHRTFTSVFPVESQTLTFEDIVGEAAGEAFYQSQTYGEHRMMLLFMDMTDIDMLSALQ